MRYFLLFLAAVAALALATGGVAAAENETVANESTDPGFEERVDSQLVLLGWQYNAETDTFTLEMENEGDRPATITITESTQQEAGSAQISILNERILPGETTLTVPVTPQAGEAAVILTTSESLEQGTGTVVSTGIYQPGPWTQTSPTAGWAGGITIMLGMTVLAGVKKMREEHDAPEQVTT